MDLVSRIKHIAGKNLALDVEVPQRFVLAGTALTYQITLRSEETVTIRELAAEVTVGEAAPGTSGWGEGHVIAAADAERDLTVEAGKPYHSVGAIPLPDDAEPTVNDTEGARYWALRVKVDVPGAVDPSATIGFVVGPAFQFEWHTAEPVTVKLPGREHSFTARGTCTVVQPHDATTREVQALFNQVIPIALAELLTDDESILETLTSTVAEGKTHWEIAGALREVLTPKIRNLDTMALDSVEALTLEQITLHSAPAAA